MSTANSDSYRLYLLGTFRLEQNGEPVLLPTRKDASLLAYLALHPQEHAREKLAALFWGDSTDKDARRSLRVALTKLRTKLGADAFVGDYATLQLNPDLNLRVDANEADVALDLYDGDLMPDYYDDWIIEEREQLRTKFVANALTHVQAARAAADYASAITIAQKILTFDRANEAAHQHLIFCYVVTGERTAALEQYAACERALREELGVEPSDETRALAAWIRQTPSVRSMAGQITNLPIPLSSFVGRRSAVNEVKEILGRTNTRVLTLVGAGGSGKTRLSIQVGTELVGTYPDGIWWVELAALNDPALVIQAVSRALGVTEKSSESLRTTLLSALRDRTLLLVLDNCEHLVDACAQLGNDILSACPNVTLLATSREALNVNGEVVWSVPTLAAPRMENVSLPALLMEYEAVRLFVERACAVNNRFELTEQNAAAVAQICRRLDGIPLALELAAARVRMLSAQDIAARLDDRFQLLSSGTRTALPRQQTLRALIDWSYDLLSEPERQFFSELSVFVGGWTLAAAEQVTTASSAAADLLFRLVDKSLVLAETRDAETRYTMLETIREYAFLRLQDEQQADAAQTAHLTYMLSYASQLSPHFVGAQQKESLDTIEAELDNVRAALDWAYTSNHAMQGLELTDALSDFWIRRSRFAEGESRYDQGLEATVNQTALRARARAINGKASLTSLRGNLDAAFALHQQALAIYRAINDRADTAATLHMLGVIAKQRSDNDLAETYFTESLSLARELQDKRLTAFDLNSLGHLAYQTDDVERAIVLVQESLVLVRQLGDKHAEGIRLNNLAAFEMHRGNLDRAEALLTESNLLNRQMNYQWGLLGVLLRQGQLYFKQGRTLACHDVYLELLRLAHDVDSHDIYAEGVEGMAGVLALLGRTSVSAQLLGAADMGRESLRLPRKREDLADYVATRTRLEAAMTPAEFEQEYAKGTQMTLDQAVAMLI